MGFQSTVGLNQAFGVAGEIVSQGPIRSQPFTLVSTPNANVIGNAFSVVSEGVAKVGGTGDFAGILINPKSYATAGASTGTLDPTLTLPDQSIGELLSMGEVLIPVSNSAKVGNRVAYNNTNGALLAIMDSASSAGAGYTFVPNAKISRYDLPSAGLGVVTLTN